VKRPLVTLWLALIAIAPVAARAQSVEQGIKLFDDKKYGEAKTVLTPLAGQNAEAAYYLGKISMVENDDDRSVEWMEQAVKLNPKSSVYHDWLGRAYGNKAMRSSKFKLLFLAPKVKNQFETAVALDPNNLDAREDLMSYYMQAPGVAGGSKQKALEMAMEIKKRNAYRGGYTVASVCVQTKDFACAERELVALRSAYPDSAGTYAQLAAFYANQKEFDKSWAVIEERLKAKPGDKAALFAVGRTGALSGQNLDRAEAALKSYLASPPDVNAIPPANVHFRLGMVYEKKGDTALARKEYMTALQLNPRLQDAKRALDALGR